NREATPAITRIGIGVVDASASAAARRRGSGSTAMTSATLSRVMLANCCRCPHRLRPDVPPRVRAIRRGARRENPLNGETSGCGLPTRSAQFVPVLKPPLRFRRFVVLAVVALAFGVAAHSAFQAIEHHDGVKDVVALCAAAVALVAAVHLGGGPRRPTTAQPLRWPTVLTLMTADAGGPSFKPSAAWLQRFRN